MRTETVPVLDGEKTWIDEYIPKIAADSSIPGHIRHDLIEKLMVVREFELEKLRTMPCPRCCGSGRVRKPGGRGGYTHGKRRQTDDDAAAR